MGGGAKSYIHKKVGPNHSLHTYLHICYTIILYANFYRPGPLFPVNGNPLVNLISSSPPPPPPQLDSSSKIRFLVSIGLSPNTTEREGGGGGAKSYIHGLVPLVNHTTLLFAASLISNNTIEKEKTSPPVSIFVPC